MHKAGINRDTEAVSGIHFVFFYGIVDNYGKMNSDTPVYTRVCIRKTPENTRKTPAAGV